MDYNAEANDERSVEWCREYGKSLIGSQDREQRSEGIRCLVKAQSHGDPEAMYLVADMILKGILRPSSGDPEEFALNMLCKSANRGNVQARSLLNSYCINRYERTISDVKTGNGRPLVDYEGNLIKINRKGVMTPIDVTLEYVNGTNILTLSANVMFLFVDLLDDPDAFERAVLKGIMEWQGNYKVFGNQTVQVKIELTTEGRIWDNVVVCPLTDQLGERILGNVNTIGTKKQKERVNSFINSKRSFAVSGLGKWSSKTRKIIYIQSEDGNFNDLEEIKHVAKHEFGHALGLGDLYESECDNLKGVRRGTFYELDGFYLSDKFYNLVMCDHHGPVSNNDIEMVILAFWKNKIQLYQPGQFKGKISKALGRGN